MPHRILVVEDDEFLRELMKLALEMDDYHVEAAEHGGKAMEMITRSPPDAVISDLEMPIVDGIHLLHWLREEAGLGIPVLVLTARNAQHAMEDARRAGANEVLIKPVAMPRILERLADLLKD